MDKSALFDLYQLTFNRRGQSVPAYFVINQQLGFCYWVNVAEPDVGAIEYINPTTNLDLQICR